MILQHSAPSLECISEDAGMGKALDCGMHLVSDPMEGPRRGSWVLETLFLLHEIHNFQHGDAHCHVVPYRGDTNTSGVLYVLALVITGVHAG